MNKRQKKKKYKNRIVYKIYPYEFHIQSSENINAQVPPIHAFERWKFQEYQPVQCKINIKSENS